MKKFQLKLIAEKFVTVSAVSEDELLKKIEGMSSREIRDLVGLPEYDVDNVAEMPAELEPDLLLHEGKLWSVS